MRWHPCLPLLAAMLVACTAQLGVTSATPCLVTAPNGAVPPGSPAAANGYGNGELWTWLWSEGTVVFKSGGPGEIHPDGSLEMKWPWHRGVTGRLHIVGRRLDAPAPPLDATVSDQYGDTGFQPTTLIFPTPGCWQVTGTVGAAQLSFVTRVVRE